MSNETLFTAKDLKKELGIDNYGLLFCFGKSMISKMIQTKTRLNNYEKVPSHVAIVYGQYLFESTTEEVDVNGKHIPKGVRRWLLTDFIKAERKKETEYKFFRTPLSIYDLEYYVHYPYGVDTIIDYLLTDGSDGVSKGLICSQYANRVAKLLPEDAPTPADLYRYCKKNFGGI